MAKFILQFNTDNAAFEGNNLTPEIVSILNNTSRHIVACFIFDPEKYVYGSIKDTNGNIVGSWQFGEDLPPDV